MAEAVESVVRQSFDSWRLTVAEDGPAEPAVSRVLEPLLRDARVEYRPTGRRLGAAGVMNSLLGDSTAAYVLFLHDDDRIGPGALQRRVTFMDANPQCGFVFSPHNDIDIDGRRTSTSSQAFPSGVLEREVSVPGLLRENVVNTMHAALVRREALAACGLWLDEGFPALYDWELWLRLGMRFPVGFLRGADVDYRVHSAQVSAGRRDADEFLRLFERADSLCAAQQPALRLGDPERRRRHARLRLAVALDHVERGERSEAIRDVRRALRERPAAVADRRFFAAVGGMALGVPGRRLVTQGRASRGAQLPNARPRAG